jgi:hypothetical protein
MSSEMPSPGENVAPQRQPPGCLGRPTQPLTKLPLSDFISECFTMDVAEREQYKAVWSVYNEWCKQNNRVPIRTTRVFWKAMRESCKLQSVESHGINYVAGVALNPNAVNRYSRMEAPY